MLDAEADDTEVTVLSAGEAERGFEVDVEFERE